MEKFPKWHSWRLWLFSASCINNPEPEEYEGGNDPTHDDDNREDEADDVDVAFAVVVTVGVFKTDFVKVVNDKTEQNHEKKNLDEDKEVVLVCDTPNNSSLILTHPTKQHIIISSRDMEAVKEI